MLRYQALENDLENTAAAYRAAAPYPHLVIDDFLDPNAAQGLLAEFPSPRDEIWFHMRHYAENTYSTHDADKFGETTRAALRELGSSRFLRWLSELTGIENLRADPSLEGAGLFMGPPGAFLNVHADFTVHPYRARWVRRVNLLLYLNRDWEPEWGGHLELWERDMSACARRVPMALNRCIVFSTDESSFHGFPDPVACPDGVVRRALNLYYYTEEPVVPQSRSTDFRARPADGRAQALGVWLDKKAIRAYDLAKRRLGISNRLGGSVMKLFAKFAKARPANRESARAAGPRKR